MELLAFSEGLFPQPRDGRGEFVEFDWVRVGIAGDDEGFDLEEAFIDFEEGLAWSLEPKAKSITDRSRINAS